jgi:bifunctional oligoribonuclease and PAP phosphatase NrnA
VNRRPSIVGPILETLRGSRTCCVVGHVRPDGDCVGSQLALTRALQYQGKRVVCWNQDPLPEKFAFLDPEGQFTVPMRGRAFDCVIAVDCASLERLGRTGACITRRRHLINIDHHISNTRYGDLNWICPADPSTGELIFRLLQQARWSLNPDLANCLYTAISTDTGSFQYPSTRPSTLRIAATLIQRGANLERIAQDVYQSFSLARIRLVRALYQRLELHLGNQVASFALRQSDYARAGAKPEDSEGLIDHLRAIAPVVVACLLEESAPDRTRISLRSKNPLVDVNQVAAQFGGGGHPAAAGATTPGTIAPVRRRLLRALAEALHAVKPVSAVPPRTPNRRDPKARTPSSS